MGGMRPVFHRSHCAVPLINAERILDRASSSTSRSSQVSPGINFSFHWTFKIDNVPRPVLSTIEG